MQTLEDWLAGHHAELTAIRRDIHAHPELGLEETRTAALVAGTLRGWGVEVTEGVGGTGVVGVIRGRKPGKRAIGLRADMDCAGAGRADRPAARLAAIRAGCMPAAMTATPPCCSAPPAISRRTRISPARVNLIFQPAEEGRGGALAMLADGLFERFPCDAIYGLHNSPGMPVGQFGTCTGPMLAAADSWKVTFRGVGGHGGSQPHLSTDITYAQAHFTLGLQGIVGRNVAAARHLRDQRRLHP